MNKKLYLILIILLVVGFIVMELLINKQQFKIVGYNPSLSKISVYTPYLDINFNDSLSQNNVSLSSPENIISSFNIVGSKTLRVFIKPPIKPNTSYRVVIDNVDSTSSKKIKNKSIIFKPIIVPVNSLSPSQTQYILQQQSTSLAKIYGTTLVNLLPFIGAGDDYEINYQTVDNVHYITITATSTQAFNTAKGWIAARGYNVATLKIKYISGQPS